MNTGYLKTLLLSALLLWNTGCASSHTKAIPIPSEAEYQRDGYLNTGDSDVPPPKPAGDSATKVCVEGCHFDSQDHSLCYVDVASVDSVGERSVVHMNCDPSCCQAAAANDRDGDGIPDDVDQCPDEPEDLDGFQDRDGCPDPDNDGDGIPDDHDDCPSDPETVNGYQDDDGCPDVVPPEEDSNKKGATKTEKTGTVSMTPGDSEGTVVENDPNLLLKEINANLAYQLSL